MYGWLEEGSTEMMDVLELECAPSSFGEGKGQSFQKVSDAMGTA